MQLVEFKITKIKVKEVKVFIELMKMKAQNNPYKEYVFQEKQIVRLIKNIPGKMFNKKYKNSLDLAITNDGEIFVAPSQHFNFMHSIGEKVLYKINTSKGLNWINVPLYDKANPKYKGKKVNWDEVTS